MWTVASVLTQNFPGTIAVSCATTAHHRGTWKTSRSTESHFVALTGLRELKSFF